MVKNILIVAPHPDDEVLGCGGIMSRFSEEGHNIYVLIVTRGISSLYSDKKIASGRKQAYNAHKILNVKETFYLDYPAPKLDLVSQAEISESISVLIKRLIIDTLYVPHRGDIHHDHKVVFNSSLVAARPVNDYSVNNIYSYETLSETEWAAPFGDDAFIPDHFVNIEKWVQNKFDAMKCYYSQLREFPNPRSIITMEALAKYRGSTVGLACCEAFMTIRTIEK